MSERTFDRPVFVKTGDHLIQEVASLEEALDFLYEWPENRRGTIYETALRACHKVYESNYPLSAAREAFAGFAKSAKILEETSAPMPWMIAPRTSQGGAPA